MTTKLQPTNIDVTLNYSMNQLSANVMVANGINLQTVNDTQNTNITTITSSAAAAFNQANGAFTSANTNAINITLVQGIDDTQNTNITNAGTYANDAFIQANSAFTQANTAVTTTNSILSPFLLMGA